MTSWRSARHGPLQFRLRNALRPDQPTVTARLLGEGVGIRAASRALVRTGRGPGPRCSLQCGSPGPRVAA